MPNTLIKIPLEQIRKEAHENSTKLPIHEVSAFLEGLLGQRLTAHLVNVSNHRLVGKWSKGHQEPGSADIQDRLRPIYQIAFLLSKYEAPYTVRAWFIGMNPDLNDKMPAELIQKKNFAPVLQAAITYISSGQ